MPNKSNNIASLPNWATFIIKAGRAAPSADNSQPWHFIWEAGKLELRPDTSQSTMALGLDHPAIGISIGCAIENITQAAHSAGIPASAIELFPDENVYLRIEYVNAADDLILHEDLALFTRHTNRNPFKLDQLIPELANQIGEQQFEGVSTQVFQNTEDIKKIADFINKASQARFQNEQIHEWFAASLRFTKQQVKQGNGLDLATLALPPGGRLLLKLIAKWSRMKMLNNLGAYKLFASIEAASLTQCGSVIAIYGNWDTAQSCIANGRVMERIWITLNENDYAVQPYFVLSDQLYRLKNDLLPEKLIPEVVKLNDEVASFFNYKDKQLLMLLRVGRPKLNPVKSLRMQLSEILSIPEQGS